MVLFEMSHQVACIIAFCWHALVRHLSYRLLIFFSDTTPLESALKPKEFHTTLAARGFFTSCVSALVLLTSAIFLTCGLCSCAHAHNNFRATCMPDYDNMAEALSACAVDDL